MRSPIPPGSAPVSQAPRAPSASFCLAAPGSAPVVPPQFAPTTGHSSQLQHYGLTPPEPLPVPSLSQVSRTALAKSAPTGAPPQISLPQPLGSRMHAATHCWPQTPTAGSSTLPQRNQFMNPQQAQQQQAPPTPPMNYAMQSAPSTQPAVSSTPRKASDQSPLQNPMMTGPVPQVPTHSVPPPAPTEAQERARTASVCAAGMQSFLQPQPRNDSFGNGSTQAPRPSPGGSEAQIRFEYGEAVQDGKKSSAPEQVGQDVVLCIPVGNCLFAAVFDGHGKNGLQIAQITRTLFEQSASMLASAAPSQLPSMFQDLFRRAQQRTEQEQGATASGTTVTAAVVDPVAQTVAIAHVGDSAAIIGNGTNLVFSTEDHDFDESDRKRVEACGGEIREFPTSMKTVRRIYAKGTQYPALALARSIGDTDAHKYGVLAEPTVSENVPFKAGHVLVLCSDGVWNAVSQDSVLNLATAGSAADAADRVVQCARENWPQSGTDYIDDISAIVIKAIPKPPGEQAKQPAQQQPAQQQHFATQPIPGFDALSNTRRRSQQLSQPLIGTGKFGVNSQTPTATSSNSSVPMFGTAGMQLPDPAIDLLGASRRPSRTMGLMHTAQLPQMTPMGTMAMPQTPTGPTAGYTVFPQPQPTSGGSIKASGTVGNVPFQVSVTGQPGMYAGGNTPKNFQTGPLPNFGFGR